MGMISLVQIMLQYAGMKSRGPGLYGEHHSTFSKMTKSLITNIQGIQNIYSQHVPLLMDIVSDIMKGKLRKETHPFVTTYTSPSTPNANTTTSSSSGIGMTNSVGVNNTVGSGNSHNPNFSTNPFMIPSEIIIFMV